MAYTKTDWKDHSVQYPKRYTEVDNGDGTITLEKAEGDVYQEGTPLNAANMNHIEQGIYDAQDTADKALPKAGGEMANTNLVVNLNADQLDGKEASDFAGKDHAHGAVSKDGKVGTVADRLLFTGAGGSVEARDTQAAVDALGISNPNILHNWDFRNPINQRGATGDVGYNAYPIDRWYNASGTIGIVPNAIRIYANSIMSQNIEADMRGLLVTVSVKRKSYSTIHYKSAIWRTEAGQDLLQLPGLSAVTVYIGVTSSGICFYRLHAPSALTDVERVKLEIGPHSTLHLDPPMDWAVELPKCQRFYQKYSGAIRFRATQVNANNVQAYFAFIHRMRTKPTTSNLDGVVRDISGNNQSGFVLDVNSAMPDGFLLFANKSSHGLTDATIIITAYEASADL
ncbi:MAG: hypothetical protein ACOYJ1_01010 [Peptococcales bacterium]|jgi:hypothetical protein